jgi:hypothetical protein
VRRRPPRPWAWGPSSICVRHAHSATARAVDADGATVLRVAKQILTDLTPGRADAEPNADDLAEPAGPVAGLAIVVA